ncbi:MAG: branched-chain amino acid aminotransferase [Alphaproteobacteria bacterium]|nr:branched-chain amino acid aminotransferase [Alphaproteobacteria bacterium]
MALIPFDDRDGSIWFDGKLVPWREAKVHVLNHGLHYASAVFEGERSYSGRIFKSREHSERLIRSAKILGMDFPYTVDEIEKAKRETLDDNEIENGYVRPVAWRGSEQMGIAVNHSKTHVAIACWEWPSYFPPEIREKGISMVTSKWRKPAPDTAPVESKAAGLYMINTMARQEAEAKGFTDALMLDYRGNVVEGTGANFFAVFDGVLVTPEPDCFLNGITRQTVLQIAQEMDIPVRIDTIKPKQLKDAEEIFITGTAAEVTAVGRIDDLEFTVGPVTRKIRQAYEDLVHGKIALKAAG